MNEQTRVLYKAAIKDGLFLSAMKSADNDDPPTFFADERIKIIFASMYYGYLVAKHGDNWQLNL